MKQKGFHAREKPLVPFVILVSFSIMFGCKPVSSTGTANGSYSLDDKALLPFAAMYEVDREQFCLTEIDRDSEVQVEEDPFRSRGYDVMLHMYSDKEYRTVAFVWEDGQYVWMEEQETHYSGRTFMTPDGELPEAITMTYCERSCGVGSVEGLIISYSAEDASIPTLYMTCEQALSYIREWEARETAPDGHPSP